MENHQAFYEENLKPGLIKNKIALKVVRILNLALLLSNIGLQQYSSISLLGSKYMHLYKYFTIWGFILTFLWSLTQVLISSDTKPKILTDSEKYSTWQVWKWSIVLYEISISSETVITLYFYITDILSIWLKLNKHATLI